MQKNQPIGVLDSGTGGLAVVAALKKLIPQEAIYYIGDIEHMPYGEKSTVQIQMYVEKIVEVLLQQHCKAIVIACATATSAAAASLQKKVGLGIPIINVIDPLVNYLRQSSLQPLGLIATPYTVQTDVYNQKLRAAGSTIDLKSLATPLLAPAIEKGIDVTPILKNYLCHRTLSGIKGLILGCTHYWLIENKIAAHYGYHIPIFSGAAWVAEALKTVLIKIGKLEKANKNNVQDVFAVTKVTDEFYTVIKTLFELENSMPTVPILINL